ncbi:MAG: hypothetical protein ACYC7E_11135 [Armatimonadota bacterium]
MRHLFGLLGLLLCCSIPASADTPLVLGLSHGEAEKRNVEFQQYGRMIPVYKQQGIQASYCEFSAFTGGWSEEAIVKLMKGYHVVALTTTTEGFYQLTPAQIAQGKVVGAALARYVREGGGLLLQPVPVRYPNSEDETYWNYVFEPLGVKILHEGAFDATRAFEGSAVGKIKFWTTRNITAHPTTTGVKTLCLPQTFMGSLPGTVAMQYAPDWRVVIRGEQEAMSYLSGMDNVNLFDKPGTYKEAPPVLAVREMGKGRLACLPLASIYTGANYLNPVWGNVFETAGDRKTGTPSDGLTLLMNSYKWLSEAARQDPTFGTYQSPPYKPIQYPPTTNWDGWTPPAPKPTDSRGIFGLHTTYTDGKGTVADYARSAKAAGLAFIVFADPLEQLTSEELTRLKADCKANSTADFYACPAIEFPAGVGNRWITWGDKIVFPDASFKDKQWTYTQWDGQRVRYFGMYAAQSGYPGNALLDYKQLRANGAHAENLWWFYHHVPFAYEGTKLFADNTQDFLFAMRDLRWSVPVSFTRIFTPNDVAAAASTCYTGFVNLAETKKALNSRCSGPYWESYASGEYISQGPQILAWDTPNNQMETNWLYTRGGQRVRLRFAVHSDDGIADVKVHDADLGPLRRFAANGARDFQTQFELVHDKQHWLILEVTDTKGRRAFSSLRLLFSIKQGLHRCSDNNNILSASMAWIPDRNGNVCLGRSFNNGAEYSLEGADSSGPVCPIPGAFSTQYMSIRGVGDYPKGVTSTLQDVRLGSYNLQIVTMQMDKVSETYDNPQRPGPALSSVPKDLGDLEYFTRTHTLYSPFDRVDWYTAGNNRRMREGTKDYKGALNWHEGEIRFKKDAVLQGAVPIPLVYMRCPVDFEKNWGTTLVVTEVERTRVELLRDPKQPIVLTGRLRPGGYIAQMPSLLGYEAFLTSAGSEFTYRAHIDGQTNMVLIGLGQDGQAVKAGTVMKYRFAFGEFADPRAGNAMLEDTVKAFNLGGGTSGYPIKMTTGTLVDALYFFTARAAGNEAAFTLGPRATMVDLPIRVQGLQDSGCAAVYSTKRPWFRFVSVVGDTAYFQEPIEAANTLWVGNIFVCDNPAVKLTVVVDGQADDAKPFIEAHNPTERPITATLRSPASTPVFGGATTQVTIPAGASIRLQVEGKTLVAK